MTKHEPVLILGDHRGQYIPKNFAEEYDSYKGTWSNIDQKDIDVLLKGPDEEWYWDAWISVCDYAVYTHTDGTEFALYQDGDVWLIPDGYKSKDFFGGWGDFDEDEEEDEEAE